jgi:rubrerythrin
MKENNTALMDAICAAIEIKGKMQALYAGAAGKCNDEVGTDTFTMLRDMETKHLERLRQIYADMQKDAQEVDSCKFYDFGTLSRTQVMRRIAREKKAVSKACLDDVAAIETGLALENRSIEFFTDKLKQASTPIEREFLNHMIAEERSHYILLADLRFYYVDTEHWFMEKAKIDLDGAGAVT